MVKRLFSLIFIAILLVSFTGCSCLNNSDELKKQQVESTINNYFAAMKSHDIDKISKYVSKGIKKLYTETKSQSVDTVEDCKAVSIDLDNMEMNDSKIKVIVNYKMTFSEDYIPVGSREIGENDIKEEFTLKEKGGSYVITDMISPYV